MDRMLWVCLGCFLAANFSPDGGEKKVDHVKKTEKKVMKNGIGMFVLIPEESIAGSGVNITIRVQNDSKEEVEFYAQGKYADYDLGLLDSNGDPVPLTRFGKIAYGLGREIGSGEIGKLRPGKHIEVTLNVARVFDLNEDGEYALTISCRLRRPNERIDLKIEKIIIKVVDEPR